MTNGMNGEKISTATGSIAWMVRNPVTAHLVMLILLVCGVLTAMTIRQEVFPSSDPRRIQISLSYPGASPEEVEQGIVLAIEEKVRGMTGIKDMTSSSREGRGTVSLEVQEGVDAQKVFQDVLQAVSRISTFPEEAEKPDISLVARTMQVINIVLFGDYSEKILRQQAEVIRDMLLSDRNITQVELGGIKDYEITISVPREALRKYNLTLSRIASKIKSLALELPSGGIKTRGGEILIRMKERREFGHEFALLPIVTTAEGSVVRLGDIATIADDLADSDNYGYYNGKPAVLVEVYSTDEETPLAVAAAAHRVVDELQESLPAGLHIEVRSDMSKTYRQRLELLGKNGLMGVLLILIVLGVFLEMRLAFWVMMSIPVSCLGGLILLPLLGVTINMMSIFGFLLALGIMVDAAVVVGENVYDHHEKGEPFYQAAIAGTQEVAVPVTYSVLTNVVTFMPLLYMPGQIGRMWYTVPVVVICVFTLALFQSLYLLPASLGHGGGTPRTGAGRKLRELNHTFNFWFTGMVEKFYSPLVMVALERRYLVLALSVAMMILTIGYVRSGRIGMIPMMQVESDYSSVTAALPYGSPVEDTQKVRARLEEAARKVALANGGSELMIGVYSRIGGSFRNLSGGHVLNVMAFLTGPGTRPISTREFTNLWRRETGTIRGLDTIMFESDRGGPGSGSSLSLQLSHSNNDILAAAGAELAERLEQFPIVSDVDSGFSPGKPQLDFRMLPEGVSLGLTTSDVAQQIRHAFNGAEALRQQRGRDEIRAVVRFPMNERESEADIEALMILTPAGT
ncbi:MAG: efflux RND transporter permease subunit, partial [Candidatus Wallbacteria bacterium]|nr:efflux RND transporter permease subunit [Candidatus Wallbacteria bacterium]